MADQRIHRTAEKGPGAVGQQRHALAVIQGKQRRALRVHRAHRQHFGVAQVQRREDFAGQLQRRIRVVVGQDQVAGAFAQGMHRLADVARHQARMQR